MECIARSLNMNWVSGRLIIGFLCALMLPSMVMAGRVLPSFSGYWYTDATTQYYDACYNPVYRYQNRYSGDPVVLAKQLLNDVPFYSTCQWGEVYIDSNVKDTSPPTDFVGNMIDWEKITKNPKAEAKLHWLRDCINPEGSVLYSQVLLIQPSYICKGSRQGLDKSSGSFGCLDASPACLADIVGRDLSMTGFGFLGHVGLVQKSFTDVIIEVLKDPKEAIYVNALMQFKNVPRAPYWGEKHSLVNEKNMNIDKANKIANAANAQRLFPFTYTLGWDYHPGSIQVNYIYNQRDQQWQVINAIQGAKFRCDSFVYYSYSAGAGLNIFSDFSAPLLPRDMFNQFLSCRDPEGTVCLAGQHAPLTHCPKNYTGLESLFSAHHFDIQQADRSTKSFIKDSHLSRLYKLNRLWNLALRHQNDPEKFNYLIDILASIKPIELTSDIIQIFNEQTNQDNQKHLLVLLVDMLHFKDPVELNEMNKQVANVSKVQNFIRELLYKSNNKEVIKYIIQVYPSIVSPQDAQREIQAVIAKINENNNGLLTEEEKMLTLLRLALATPEQQKNLLPLLIEQYQSYSLFAHSLCFLLADMSPKQLDHSIKEKIAHQLVLQKSQLIGPALDVLSSQDRDFPPCNWLSAYAVVRTSSDLEKNQFIFNYLKKEPDIFMQAALMSQLSLQQEKLITSEEKTYYRNRFERALKENHFENTLNSKSALLRRAISQLDEIKE